MYATSVARIHGTDACSASDTTRAKPVKIALRCVNEAPRSPSC